MPIIVAPIDPILGPDGCVVSQGSREAVTWYGGGVERAGLG